MGATLWPTTPDNVVNELLDGYESPGPGRALVDYDLNDLAGQLALYTLNWCGGCREHPGGGLWIGIDFILVDGGFAGYRIMDESMCPYRGYACPLEWLSEPRLAPAQGYAAKYRREVADFWRRHAGARFYRHWSWPGVWPDWAGVGWPDLSGRLRGGAS